MTDATMLERASKAVREIDPELTSDEAEEFARAVLTAVREPGSEAVNAGVKAGHAASGLSDILHVPSAFTAMIDAILADGEGR